MSTLQSKQDGDPCELVAQHRDKHFEVIRFASSPEGSYLDRAYELAEARNLKYVTCARLESPTPPAPSPPAPTPSAPLVAAMNPPPPASKSEPSEREKRLLAERDALLARAADLEMKLTDARDEVYELRQRNSALESVNEEMRAVSGAVGVARRRG